MRREKKQLLTSLMILAFAVIILLGALISIRQISPQQTTTGRFIFDNGCYGIYNAGKISCIASNIGKKCVNGCYVAATSKGNKCECLPG